MRRRSRAGGTPVKARRPKPAARKRLKAPKVRGRGTPAPDSEIAQVIRERDKALEQLSEALEQQTATSDVLRIISSSPGDLDLVFETMLENAARVCDAKSGNIFRWDGEFLHHVAAHNTPTAFGEVRRAATFRMDGARTELSTVERNGHWAVRITWPNGTKHYFGQFPSEREASQWIEEHRWMTAKKIDEAEMYRRGRPRVNGSD
jgi:hypothetical protein